MRIQETPSESVTCESEHKQTGLHWIIHDLSQNQEALWDTELGKLGKNQRARGSELATQNALYDYAMEQRNRGVYIDTQHKG